LQACNREHGTTIEKQGFALKRDIHPSCCSS